MIETLKITLERDYDLWFWSDTHFGHENIIKLANRPFDNANEMDSTMFNNFQGLVKPNDIVIHLGDLTCASSKSAIKSIYDRLPADFHYHLLGNHDTKRSIFEDLGVKTLAPICNLEVTDGLSGEIEKFVLSHYPIVAWEGQYKGTKHLYGHTHLMIYNMRNSLNICVEHTNYTPLSYYEILWKIESGRVG